MLSPLEFIRKMMDVEKCPLCGKPMNVSVERLPGGENTPETYRAEFYCACGLTYNPNCERLTDEEAIDAATKKWNEAVHNAVNNDTKLKQHIDSLISINLKSGVSQGTYVAEECSELIKELMKQNRGKGNSDNIVAESCDVITTILVMLREMGVPESLIKDQIKSKCERAVARYENSGEV